MTYAFAATRPVNTPGAAPSLTEEQLWKGLDYKARNPMVFFPMITETNMKSDEGNKFERESTLDNGHAITESIELHAPTIVYAEMSIGWRVTNMISYGPAGELLLTISSANGIPGVAPDKPKPSAQELNAMTASALEKTLGVIRELVKEGKL
ncbi:DUF1857-domain-containing protein [Mycena alexandri]|uniref:DUF1857-domain-containing protein n=1 Tax=Mycena alexandri TaxID=1745969 RepID=A0AAD6T847_9AGAR|nr:DUF1857-domain-containing protein [Mycena alexandri]